MPKKDNEKKKKTKSTAELLDELHKQRMRNSVLANPFQSIGKHQLPILLTRRH